MKHRLTNRREFLRGVGAAIALPAYTSLMPARSAMAKTSNAALRSLGSTNTGVPLRTAFLYFPNGAIPSAWWPKDSGQEGLQLSPTLKPLESVKDSIQVLGGLDQKHAEPGMDGGGDHARGSGTFLTGVRVRKSSVDIHAGISIDQAIAAKVGNLTRFSSLELSCEQQRKTGECDSGYSCAYQYNISWKTPTTPMAPEANPRLVFERLFGSGTPKQRANSLAQRRLQQRSVLDFVLEDARQMKSRLQVSERQKMDEYLTSVRAIERRIEKAERLGDAKTYAESPTGIPPSFEAHLQLMFDMLLLAFQTDSTRVATLCLAHDGSNRSFEDLGITEGHHELSHHQNKKEKIEKLKRIDHWYTQQLAAFLKRLKSTADVDGNSLLDNSMVLFGSGNADGNRHTHTNLPVILAGGGGGTLQNSRYVDHKSQPLSNLYLSMAHRMGVTDLNEFGDSTGPLTDV